MDLRKRPLAAVYFTSSQELTQPRGASQNEGRVENGNCYFRAISFILTGVAKKSAGCKGQIELFGIWKRPQLERNLRTYYLDKTATDYPKSYQGRIKY